jgi:hypothetical protein
MPLYWVLYTTDVSEQIYERWTKIVGAIAICCSAFVAAGMVVWNVRQTRENQFRIQRKDNTNKLHQLFMFDPNWIKWRMSCQALLRENASQDSKEYESNKGKNFEEIRRKYLAENPENWHSISAMISFFRNLNKWKDTRFIDEEEARDLFSWTYTWWWCCVFRPYSMGATTKLDSNHRLWSEWEPALTKFTWLFSEPDADKIELLGALRAEQSVAHGVAGHADS